MKLFLHNSLGCMRCSHYPLDIVAEPHWICYNPEPLAPSFSPDDAAAPFHDPVRWLHGVLKIIDYGVLRSAVDSLRETSPSLAAALPPLPVSVYDFAREVSASAVVAARVLCGIDIVRGALVCPACGVRHPIVDGILHQPAEIPLPDVAADE